MALGSVLAMRPEVLLLDEPTNGLDEVTERRLVDHLSGLDQAMLFVSHDRRLVGRLATRAVLLEDGNLLDGAIHTHPHTHTHEHVHIHPLGSGTGHEHEGAAPAHGDHHRDE